MACNITINKNSQQTASPIQSDTSVFDMFENKNRNQINIAIVGAVSAGKSTLLNTIFAKTYSHCKIKRTTMTPQIYYEYDGKSAGKKSKMILEENKAINECLIKKTENNEQISLDDIKEARYIVPKIYKFTKLVKDIYLSIYDIPGLNDARTKDLYFDYIENNFYKFDIILFVVDINSALNTSDEIEILTKIISNCKTNRQKYGIYNKLLVLPNKCDEMSLNDWGKLQLEEEHDEMLLQIQTQVRQKVEEIYPQLEYDIMPLSSEDSYIYRILERNPESELDMKYLNKFGYMEFGRTRWNKLPLDKKKQQIQKLMNDWDIESSLKITGFKGFSNTINSYLTPENQKMFVNNHIMYEIKQITGNTKVDISDDIQRFYEYYLKYKSLDTRISSGIDVMELFSSQMQNYLEGYKQKVLDGFIDGVEDPCIKELDNIHVNGKVTIKYKGKGTKSSKHYSNKHKNTTTHPVPTCISYSIKTESFVTQIEESKKVVDNMARLFNGDVPYIETLSHMINSTLTRFYSRQIDNKTKPVSTLFNYIKSLLGFNVVPSESNIENFFENPEMVNSHPKQIISYLDKFKAEGLLDDESKLSKTLDVLLKIYTNIGTSPANTEESTPYLAREDYPSYVYFTNNFWTKFLMFNDSYDDKIERLAFLSKVNCTKKLANSNTNVYFNNNAHNLLLLENYYLDMFTKHISIMMHMSTTINQQSSTQSVTKGNNTSVENTSSDTSLYSDMDDMDDIGQDIDRELGFINTNA